MEGNDINECSYFIIFYDKKTRQKDIENTNLKESESKKKNPWKLIN